MTADAPQHLWRCKDGKAFIAQLAVFPNITTYKVLPLDTFIPCLHMQSVRSVVFFAYPDDSIVLLGFALQGIPLGPDALSNEVLGRIAMESEIPGRTVSG